MFAAPCVTLSASGFHNVNALTGPADQWRHDAQWQQPIAGGLTGNLELHLAAKAAARVNGFIAHELLLIVVMSANASCRLELLPVRRVLECLLCEFGLDRIQTGFIDAAQRIVRVLLFTVFRHIDATPGNGGNTLTLGHNLDR